MNLMLEFRIEVPQFTKWKNYFRWPNDFEFQKPFKTLIKISGEILATKKD